MIKEGTEQWVGCLPHTWQIGFNSMVPLALPEVISELKARSNQSIVRCGLKSKQTKNVKVFKILKIKFSVIIKFAIH